VEAGGLNLYATITLSRKARAFLTGPPRLTHRDRVSLSARADAFGRGPYQVRRRDRSWRRMRWWLDYRYPPLDIE